MKVPVWLPRPSRLRLAACALLATSAAWAQSAPTDTTPVASAPPAAAPVAPGADAAAAPAVKLTPFEVDADAAKGYFTPNTVGGTRLNNNIGDIPSSVTVIDKQQIEDTNSQNINDIMLYEANTEGSHTFTPVTGFTESGGYLTDALAGSNDGGVEGGIGGSTTLSSRVRGLGAPDNEVDNFYGLYRIPFDTYNVQSVEIDRGPNSLMFGAGSAAGIVNASSSQAQLDKLSGDASVQASSWGGVRETSDLNIPLLRNHVALYLAQEYTAEGFQRQPSADLTRRQYATLTIDPFKSHRTKITASAEFWNNYANDENTLMPYDYVTPWLAAGKPMMNPLTDTVTYLATGKTEGPYVSSTTSPLYVPGEPVGTGQLTTLTSSLFAPGIAFESNHLTEFYANGQQLYAFQPGQTLGSPNGGITPAQTPATYTAAGQIINQSAITQSTSLPIPGVGSVGAPGGYAAWQQPAVSSMSIYNWQNGPNLLSSDYTQSRARTYHFDFQQEILPNLNADVAFFRQEFHDFEDDLYANHIPLKLFVDTNSYLLNGQPNAYAGSTYVQDESSNVGGYQRPETNQNWRAMLEYSLDLRDKVPSWLKWLGHHRFMAEASTHDDVSQVVYFRYVVNGGDGSYASNLYQLNNTPAIPGNYNIVQNSVAPWRNQYVSAPGSTVATAAPGLTGSPGYGSPTNFNVTTYNYSTGQWVTSGLKQLAVGTYYYGSLAFQPWSENVQDQKTYYWQSFFWNDRIVGSLGINDDIVKNRTVAPPPNAPVGATSNNPGLVEYIGGILNPAFKYNVTPWNPVSINGVEQSLGEVGGNTFSEGFVIKPFESWATIDRAADQGNLLAGFIRTVGFTFNKSDNFNPPAGTYTDLFGNPLPKPTGNEKDYGLEIATPDKKLYLRMTWYRSSSENNTTGVSSTITSRTRYVDQNELFNWATTVVELRSGQDPTNVNFGNQSVTPLTQAQENQISALTQLPYNYATGVSPSGGYLNVQPTNTTTSGGTDVELTYNPTPNWTIKVTGGRQDAKLSAVDSQAKAYLAVRLPYWQAVGAADFPNVITNYHGAGTSSLLYVGNFWNSYGYDSAVPLSGGINGGPTRVQDYFQNAVGIPLAVEEAAQGTNVPGESKYSWRLLTNYTIATGPLRNLGVGGGLRWISSAIQGYYGDQANLNAAGQVAADNLNEPIYSSAMLHADAWISYAFKLPWDQGRIRGKVQLNVSDLTSNGYLLPIQYNLDGSPASYRIIPPRQFALTTSFHF
jgi:outer membrane receptor protein involved in Fe transport